MTVQQNINYLNYTLNKDVYYEKSTGLYYIINDNGNRVNVYEELFEISYGETPPRFEHISDDTGHWIRDNETGLEYSSSIGLKIIPSEYFNQKCM